MSKKIFNTRTGRRKNETVKAYSLFLTIVRQKQDEGIAISLKQLSETLHIGSNISRNDLPEDIFTAPYEVVTSLAYAQAWLDNYLRPLRQQRRAATIAKKSNPAEEPVLSGIFDNITPSLADVLAEIERATKTFIENMEAEISKAKSLINN